MILKLIFISAILATGGCIEDVSTLNLTGNFDSQVHIIFKHYRLNVQEIVAFDRVYEDLHETLTPEWPGLQILPFGSVVNGLGLKSSDADCVIMIPNATVSQALELTIRTEQLLKNRTSIFSDIVAVTAARVPVIKFIHAPSGRHGDISFSGVAAVWNSQLVKFLLHMDDRALPLAVLVKYWSKVHSLTGTNLMASYSLILQVIFYLQQKHIIPAAVDLQKNVPSRMVGIWNTAFDDKYKFQTDNNETLYQLLGGFFQYYSDFDYDRYLISSYLGRLIERREFLNAESLPDEFSLYKQNVRSGATKPLNLKPDILVQDIFEHYRSCAAFVHSKLVKRVISHFGVAAKKFLEDNEDSFLRAILTKNADEEIIYITYGS